MDRSSSPRQKDPQRETRIRDEIIVDANGPEEQAMGWYYYVQDKLQCPFLARCVQARAISPLRVGDEIEVLGLASAEECEHEIFVETQWSGRTLAVPLSQIEPITATDEETREAVADWHYWIERGYEW